MAKLTSHPSRSVRRRTIRAGAGLAIATVALLGCSDDGGGDEAPAGAASLEGLEHPVELVAWGFRLPLEAVTDPRTEAFIEEFIDAPTAPEAGAGCEGALGTPPNPPELPTS